MREETTDDWAMPLSTGRRVFLEVARLSGQKAREGMDCGGEQAASAPPGSLVRRNLAQKASATWCALDSDLGRRPGVLSCMSANRT